MSSSTAYAEEKHRRSRRRQREESDQDHAKAPLVGSHRSNSRSHSRSRQETKAEEPKIPKKVPVERNVVSAGKSATKSKATHASETSEKPTAPKPKKTAKSTAKFAKGFAALDLYPEAKRSCFVCQEEQPESKSYNMGCRNRHWSCVDCLKAGFEAYFVDFENPPRCCGPPVNFHQVATTVFLKERHRDFLERGLQRMADLSTMMADKKHDFHCAAPDCGTSLKKLGKSGDKKFGVCNKCEKKTCKNCKSLWVSGHSSVKCQNAGDVEVERLAKSLNLKSTKCPHCDKPNVKTEGCNLVQCPCQGLYCYVCRATVDFGKPMCEHIGRR